MIYISQRQVTFPKFVTVRPSLFVTIRLIELKVYDKRSMSLVPKNLFTDLIHVHVL